MEYTILSASSLINLIGFVCEEMSGGWQPQGGVAATVETNGNTRFFQAMIKYPQPSIAVSEHLLVGESVEYQNARK